MITWGNLLAVVSYFTAHSYFVFNSTTHQRSGQCVFSRASSQTRVTEKTPTNGLEDVTPFPKIPPNSVLSSLEKKKGLYCVSVVDDGLISK